MDPMSFEMGLFLNKNSNFSDSVFEDDGALSVRDLPSCLARHSTSTMMRRKSVGHGHSTKRHRTFRRVVPSRSAWSGDDAELTNDVFGTVDDFKAVPLPMTVRRLYKDYLKTRTPRKISKWVVLMSSVTMGWQNFRNRFKDGLYSLQLWRGHLKTIEGQFGSGVVSYFVFLRWLMFLNLIIFLLEFGFVSLPTLVICSNTHERDSLDANTTANFSRCKYDFPSADTNGSVKSVPTVLLDFFTGQGWISNTILFYSSYPSDVIISQEGVKYLLPLAYLLTGGAYLFICLVLMIKSVSSELKEGYIETEGVLNSFSNKVFSAWDYCICERSTAEHKKQVIAQEIRSELAEEERLMRVRNRTKKQKMQLYGMRLFINLIIVPALWYVSFVVVIGIIINQKVTNEGRNKFEEMLIRSALALGVTVPNLILPPLFEFLSFFEDWSPKFELGLNLWRRIFIKLPSIAVLMSLLYKDLVDRINSGDALKSHCEHCWENEIAAQMYMLVWVDFIVVLLITVGYETMRKVLFQRCRRFKNIGLAQFDIPRNVIDLAYGQCLILIGTFFSPILPVLAVLKLIVFFYAKKLSLFHNNRLPDRLFQGAKLNTIFTLLLLFTFFMYAGLVGWGVARVPTSFCGPFKNVHCSEEKAILDELYIVISNWPMWLREWLTFMSTAAFLLPLLALSLVVLYYYRSVAHAHRHVIDKLRNHLVFQGRYNKNLFIQLMNSSRDLVGPGEAVKYSEDDILMGQVNSVNSLEMTEKVAH